MRLICTTSREGWLAGVPVCIISKFYAGSAIYSGSTFRSDFDEGIQGQARRDQLLGSGCAAIGERIRSSHTHGPTLCDRGSRTVQAPGSGDCKLKETGHPMEALWRRNFDLPRKETEGRPRQLRKSHPGFSGLCGHHRLGREDHELAHVEGSGHCQSEDGDFGMGRTGPGKGQIDMNQPLGVSLEWIRCVDILPPDGDPVPTKIDDAKGCRNEQDLKRQGNLWFVPDGSIYVYYTPTHWRPL